MQIKLNNTLTKKQQQVNNLAKRSFWDKKFQETNLFMGNVIRNEGVAKMSTGSRSGRPYPAGVKNGIQYPAGVHSAVGEPAKTMTGATIQSLKIIGSNIGFSINSNLQYAHYVEHGESGANLVGRKTFTKTCYLSLPIYYQTLKKNLL